MHDFPACTSNGRRDDRAPSWTKCLVMFYQSGLLVMLASYCLAFSHYRAIANGIKGMMAELVFLVVGIAAHLPSIWTTLPLRFARMDARSSGRDGTFVFTWRSFSPCGALLQIGRPPGAWTTHVKELVVLSMCFCLGRCIGMLGQVLYVLRFSL